LAQLHQLLHPALLLSGHSGYARLHLVQLLQPQLSVLLLPQQHLRSAQQEQQQHPVSQLLVH
jgi:hypothetical protein